MRFALENIHFPADEQALLQARRRLVFEELLTLQIGLLRLKARARTQTAAQMNQDDSEAFFALLPFSPPVHNGALFQNACVICVLKHR